MFLRSLWTLLVVSCVLFASYPVRGEEIVIVERDANAGLGQGFNPDLTGAMLMAREFDDTSSNGDKTTHGPPVTTLPPDATLMAREFDDDGSDHESPCESESHTSTRGLLTTTVTASTCPTLTPQSLPTAICSIATALCAACPPIVVTTTATISSCPLATVTKTVTECPGPITTSRSTFSSQPFSSSAPPTPSSSIRFSNSSTIPSSSSVIPSSSSGRPATTTGPATTRSSTPMGPNFSSTIPPRTTTSSTPSTLPTSTEPVRPSSPRGEGTTTTTRRPPPGIVRREMMGNITAIVTNTTRTFANATTSGSLNLTAIRTETTATTTGVFPRFQRARFRY